MAVLYRVKPLSGEVLALEALQVVVKKHNDGELPEKEVHNTLQAHRKSIDVTLADLIELDKKTAGEFLDQSMAVRYQGRISDLAGVLLSVAANLNSKAGKGVYNIIPMYISSNLRLALAASKNPVPTYLDVKEYLMKIALYAKSLEKIKTYTNMDLYVEPEVATRATEEIRSLIGTFTSPCGKLDVTGDLEDYEVTWSEESIPRKQTFEEAGWTPERLVEIQTNFSGVMVELSKAIFSAAQAMNRFNMMTTQARSFSLFSYGAERMTEALCRIPTFFAEAFIVPWMPIKQSLSQPDE